MRRRRGWKLFLLLLVACLAAAQGKYSDPDSADTEAAARKALANAKILNIVGVTSGIQALLEDLGAKVIGQQITINLAADVLFDFDKAEILPKAIPSLQKVATVLKSYPNAESSIEGHTDGLGDDAYNQKLSERRAEAVKTWLQANGSPSRMTSRGWGRTKPVAPNKLPNGKDNPEGRQKNRRVEIIVKTG